MADSKIDFAFENLHFSCEGDNAWVEKQLNNVLSRIPTLLAVHKKGEPIVEEVIDVQEIKPRAARSKATVKPGKAKAVKTVKEEVAKEPEVKAPKAPKAAKTPKEKAPKAVKVAKVLKEKAPKAAKVAKGPKVMAEKVVKAPKVKAVKVPKVKAPKVPKLKKVLAKAKKKVVKKSPFVERTDSPLYQFISEKKAEKNQIRKFLAAAVYLAKSNEMIKLSTPVISKELKLSGIEKLQNASDCLNKNEKKGYCIKEGKGFVITENGFLSIG